MRNSRAVVGFWLVHLLRARDAVAAMIAELLEAVASGKLEVVDRRHLSAFGGARAHEDLAGPRDPGQAPARPDPYD